MEDLRPITVTTHIDPETGEATLTVDRFPRVTTFDFSGLASADPDVLAVEDTVVRLHFANGTATYRLALSEMNGASAGITAYLESSRLSDA